MIDDEEKWNDINELAKANPNLGVSVSVDYMLEEIAIAEGSLSKKAEFLTKYCCIKQSSEQAWLATKIVDAAVCGKLSPEDFYNCYAVGGIDLSQTTDLTSACVVIEKDGIEYVISHFWLPAEKIDEAIARDDIPYREMIERGVLSLSGEGFVDYNDVFKTQCIASLQNRTIINVSGLADGMYFVRVTTDGGVVTKNFVKR